MTDDQNPKPPGLNLNTPEMKALLDSISDMASRAQEPDAFDIMMARPANIPPMLKCGHSGQWGSEPFAPGGERAPTIPFIHGVRVVTSEHIPPDTMLLLSNPKPYGADWPPVSLIMPDSPKDGFNHHAQEWERDFSPLLQAVHHQLINTNRGRFNTIIVADESPIIPERPRVCWTCGQTFMSRRMVGAVRQCDYCMAKFDRKRAELHDNLRCLADQVFMQTLIQKGYTSWTLPRPRPPFKSASQTRAAAQKAKAKARRKTLRSRKRSNKASQRA